MYLRFRHTLLRYMLEGRPFTIYTDHKCLTFALGKVSELWTAMQLRQLSYLRRIFGTFRAQKTS
jgi:hypothetical protein